MTAGWFDAWRDDGGPALHADPNRTHVTVDTPELFICIAFVTLFVAFLIIVPALLLAKQPSKPTEPYFPSVLASGPRPETTHKRRIAEQN
ncbi:DUOXA protein C06E1.3-like [Tropilaelaps mercedesae]|uniref:DUOXA protein C06E1.3-like n=1 Tax=Tropilaelaps mercedesae TaxID=418985 RepID=A0A1V9XR31_9ACAR|nr:DUOXA protein C06E1.3-like [Tropilaelaps mercedesae]